MNKRKCEALVKKHGMTKCGLPFGPVYGPALKEKVSFCAGKLNKPGTLVLMENGKLYLIGDINCIRGMCDDCTAFEAEDIVVAYKVVWEN